MNNATIDDFCRYLEGQLDRPLIDETNLEGRFTSRSGMKIRRLAILSGAFAINWDWLSLSRTACGNAGIPEVAFIASANPPGRPFRPCPEARLSGAEHSARMAPARGS